MLSSSSAGLSSMWRWLIDSFMCHATMTGYISVVLFGNSKELFRLYDFLHAHVMFRLIILSMLLLY